MKRNLDNAKQNIDNMISSFNKNRIFLTITLAKHRRTFNRFIEKVSMPSTYNQNYSQHNDNTHIQFKDYCTYDTV